MAQKVDKTKAKIHDAVLGPGSSQFRDITMPVSTYRTLRPVVLTMEMEAFRNFVNSCVIEDVLRAGK